MLAWAEWGGGGCHRLPEGRSNGPGQEKTGEGCGQRHHRSLSDNFSHPGRRLNLSEAIVFSLSGPPREAHGRTGRPAEVGGTPRVNNSRWLPGPQEGAASDLSRGGPGGHFLICKAEGWITGTEAWETRPDLAERASWNGLSAHALGDFPQDKTNVLRTQRGVKGHKIEECSVCLRPCSLSV